MQLVANCVIGSLREESGGICWFFPVVHAYFNLYQLKMQSLLGKTSLKERERGKKEERREEGRKVVQEAEGIKCQGSCVLRFTVYIIRQHNTLALPPKKKKSLIWSSLWPLTFSPSLSLSFSLRPLSANVNFFPLVSFRENKQTNDKYLPADWVASLLAPLLPLLHLSPFSAFATGNCVVHPLFLAWPWATLCQLLSHFILSQFAGPTHHHQATSSTPTSSSSSSSSLFLSASSVFSFAVRFRGFLYPLNIVNVLKIVC